MNKLLLSLLALMLLNFKTYANQDSGFNYRFSEKDNHIIHILTIDPKRFNLKLVKAHNQVIGRETVEEIALRTNAIAAINAGFFEIAGSDDGRPSLTLMVDGKLFSLRKQMQSLLILDQDNIQITKNSAKISVKIGDKLIIPGQVNYFSNPKDITLYNDVWASTTLTPYTNKEILIDENFIVTGISKHGDNPIPSKGFVLSFPSSIALPSIKTGDSVKLNLEFLDKDEKPMTFSKTASMVTGIPMLVQASQSVVDKSDNKESSHARTAIGIRSDGVIVIVVAEHVYKQHIKDLKLAQVRSILKKEKGINIEKLTIAEALKILEKQFVDDQTTGLTKAELADYMISLGCESAINLDGGGSSTLFINGKVVNKITGDKDEALGEHVQRPVSDAIVILPKQ
ncbi:phosphodiester glycosidase family protein [Rickettsia bellii]|uniref:Phosphodiester glycosidase domain-containing protein n=1 Tax=Rickettsia bellii (strain RML369-C) TaxID=336407 RepID=Q1RIB0_RICBR|nr:phosphodiester glycosidase family protein [Rickettsia bellii]ABE04904.1 unknown [Rickettsia bellii RML369-C]